MLVPDVLHHASEILVELDEILAVEDERARSTGGLEADVAACLLSLFGLEGLGHNEGQFIGRSFDEIHDMSSIHGGLAIQHDSNTLKSDDHAFPPRLDVIALNSCRQLCHRLPTPAVSKVPLSAHETTLYSSTGEGEAAMDCRQL
jgi:hypothetical protein